jgi:hypothetical protein
MAFKNSDPTSKKAHCISVKNYSMNGVQENEMRT